LNEKIKLNPNNLNLKESCYWYPCHNGISLEEYDCRSCYCPLYKICSKIKNDKFGGYLLKYIDNFGVNQEVWACENCVILHKKEYVDYYNKFKKQNFSDEYIIKELIKMSKNL
jgi:Zn-finger protein